LRHIGQRTWANVVDELVAFHPAAGANGTTDGVAA
jgi:hypothetical protein